MTIEEPATIATVLMCFGLPALGVYFYLFQRLIGSLPEADRRRFIQDAALPAWRRVVGITPIVLVVLISNAIVRAVLIAWFCVQLILDSRAHDVRLDRTGFTRSFRARLTRISFFGGVVTFINLLGVVMFGLAAQLTP